jgi:hypothetical protein
MIEHRKCSVRKLDYQKPLRSVVRVNSASCRRLYVCRAEFSALSLSLTNLTLFIVNADVLPSAMRKVYDTKCVLKRYPFAGEFWELRSVA